MVTVGSWAFGRGRRAVRFGIRVFAIVVVVVVAAGVSGVVGPSGSRAAATSGFKLEANVSYGPNALQDMDIYLPIGATAPTPAVLLIHGGSFSAGDKSQQDTMAGSLAEVGWAAIAVNYRLLGYPYEPEDVLSALAYVRSNAASLNINPNLLALQGSSSGGTLVLEAIMDAGDLGGSTAGVQAVSSWSGPTDFASLVTWSGVSPDVLSTVSGYLGCTYAACPALYNTASPDTYVSSTDPPMFLPTGSQDPAVPSAQQYELSNDLAAVGVTSQVYVIPGSLHGQLFEPEAMQPMVNFFTPYLGPTWGPVPAINNPPTVTGVSPSIYQGEVQAQLVLTGTLFDPGATIETDAPGITVGKVYVPTRQSIEFGLTVSSTTPTGTYNVVEANPDGTGAECTNCLIVTSDPVPAITGVSPAAIGPNDAYSLTVTGTGFTVNSSVSTSTTGATVVFFQDKNASSITMTYRLLNTAPPGPASVTVTTPGGAMTCGGCLVIDPPPQVTFVTALASGSSTLATVNGTGFVPGLTVATNITGASVGLPVNVTATSFQVTITVPSGTSSGTNYTLQLRNPDGGQGYYSHLSVS